MTDVLEDDEAFRHSVLAFIELVPLTILNTSTGRQLELQALVAIFFNTSQDIKMQEGLVSLHKQYDLIGRGYFAEGPLREMVERVAAAVAEPVAAGAPSATAIAEDTVGIASDIEDDPARPAELEEEDLGVETEDVAKAKETQGGAGYVVGWQRRC